MTGRRGHPVTFDTPVRQAYLAAVANGMLLGPAANHVGVSINVPRRHERTNPDFAAALAEAKAHGKKLRDDAKDHSEAHYNHQKCRSPQCVAAARTGRAGRRQRAAEPDPAEVHDMRPKRELPPSFPLARAS